ncbi:MAG: hypothetical protein WA040_23260 [Anaerolineae bacterium]
MATLLLLLIPFLLAYALAHWLHGRGRLDARKDVLAAALLALACIGYFWRVIFGDSFMPADGGDLISFLWPTYRFAAESLRAGEWPLWNPHLYSGAPHVADIQAGFLYPPNLALFLAVPDFGARAMQGMSILHLWWAGLGMYVLLRSLRAPGASVTLRLGEGSRSASRDASAALSMTRPGDASAPSVSMTGPGDASAALSMTQQARGYVSRPAALAAGIAFAFSDPFWVHFGNLNLNAVASWLPWVVACYVQGLEGRQVDKETGRQGEEATTNRLPFTVYRSLAWSAAAGLLLGIATLAGHIQSTLFIGVTVVLYGLFWLFFELQEPGVVARQAALRFVGNTALLAALGILIAAPVLLPAIQLSQYTARAAWSYQETVGYSLSPAQWIGLVVPGFFGRGPQLHWGLWPRVEVGYIGILPLALAVLALLGRRNRHTWTFLGIAAVGFLLALGIYSIPHGWLSLLPGFDLLRAPGRFVLLMSFGLAALAGIGLQVLLSPIGDSEAWKALTRLGSGLGWVSKAAAAVIVPLVFAALLLTQDRDPTVYLRVAIAAIAVTLAVAFLWASWALVAARRAGWARPRTLAALAVALIFLDLASTGAYNDLGDTDPSESFQQPDIVAFLQQAEDSEPFRIDARTGVDQLWQPNTALLYGLDDVWGGDNPSLFAPYERYWEGMGSRSSRLYDFLNARYVIARKDVALDWEKFVLAFDGDPDLNVYRNGTALPRAFVVHEARVVSGADATEQAWAAVQDPAFDPATQVVIEPGEAQLPTVAPAAGPETVRWLARSNNELILEVTATAPGYLVLSEVWYPGWQAQTVLAGQGQPGQPQPVLRANSAFRAIPLWQAGTQVVRLRFTPPLWRIGWLAAGLTLLLLVTAGIVLLQLRKRRSGYQPDTSGLPPA